MPISVQCTACGKTLKVPDTMAGKRGKCPCGNVISVPAGGGGFQAAAPARAPAGGGRPSKAMVSKGGGDFPAARTFPKLFNIWLLCLGLEMVLGIVMAVVLSVGLSSAASKIDKAAPPTNISIDDAFKDLEKRQKEQEEAAKGAMGALAGAGIGGTITGCGLTLVYLIQFVVGLMFIYKAWALIQDGTVRTTPMMAILLLFVPIFQIYWYFVAYWGLAKDLNTYAQERGIDARKASEGMILWGLVLLLLGCTAPIGAIMLLLGFNSIKNACFDIATAKAGA
ncbi:MAG: hypothetical protein K2R98_07410 [Gemmataceae bacterium]|nr:hypothetical protein [Gemmataceae bacterium]